MWSIEALLCGYELSLWSLGGALRVLLWTLLFMLFNCRCFLDPLCRWLFLSMICRRWLKNVASDRKEVFHGSSKQFKPFISSSFFVVQDFLTKFRIWLSGFQKRKLCSSPWWLYTKVCSPEFDGLFATLGSHRELSFTSKRLLRAWLAPSLSSSSKMHLISYTLCFCVFDGTASYCQLRNALANAKQWKCAPLCTFITFTRCYWSLKEQVFCWFFLDWKLSVR